MRKTILTILILSGSFSLFAQMNWDIGDRDFLSLLSSAQPYNTEVSADLPTFSYEKPNTMGLKATNEYFRLDTIAQGGDELERITAILRFVSDAVPHDGNHSVPGERNAISIYEHSMAYGNRGVNCRNLAIMLSECYLAAGFDAFHVTCLPEDEKDTECHVITAVWSENMQKWLWMDPSFNLYLMDGDGVVLDFKEVRRRVIAGDIIRVSPHARYQGYPVDKEAYIDRYMVKNLYWFNRPVRSLYNTETKRTGTSRSHIALIPPGYERKNYNYSSHLTSNEDYFWSH